MDLDLAGLSQGLAKPLAEGVADRSLVKVNLVSRWVGFEVNSEKHR